MVLMINSFLGLLPLLEQWLVLVLRRAKLQLL